MNTNIINNFFIGCIASSVIYFLYAILLELMEYNNRNSRILTFNSHSGRFCYPVSKVIGVVEKDGVIRIYVSPHMYFEGPSMNDNINIFDIVREELTK